MKTFRFLLAGILFVLTFPVFGFSQKKLETKSISHTVLIVDDFESNFDWQRLWLEDLRAIGVAVSRPDSSPDGLETGSIKDISCWVPACFRQ